MAIKADICIIGAGSGGLSVAAGAAQLGRKVVLIEKGEMGGDCLNYGCVPSKALLAAGKHAQTVRDSAAFGVAPQEPSIDFSAVREHVRGVIASIAPHDSQERFEGFGVRVIRAAARFVDARTVEAGGETIKAKHFVIATGSSPFRPPIPGLEDVPYFTNETIFENDVKPDHLIIVGGGPIGMEMAQAHRRLGAEVTVVEASKALAKDDPDAAAVVLAALRDEGVSILEDTRVASVALGPNGGVEVSLEANGARRTLSGSHILIAVGRRPNVFDMGLEAAGVEHSERGIKVDDRLRTSVKRIYAMGDVIGGRQFTHVAGYHAGIIVRNILFKVPAKNQDDLAPWTTYTDPELAQVGLTEASAREKHGDKIRVARWSAGENDRAQTERRTEGFIKVITDRKGRILGATIVAPHAGELINPWALALSSRLKISAFTAYIAPYPTYGELSKRAAGAWYTPTLFSGRTRALVGLLSIFD